MHTMRFRWAPLQLLLALAPGCANPRPELLAVVPDQAFSDQDTRLTLLGRDFVPAATLDPVSGRRIATSDGFVVRLGTAGQWVELGAVAWLATGTLAVTLPSAMAQRLPAAPLDVEVTDPRGQATTLPAGFHALGPDLVAPSLVFTSPASDAPFASGMLLSGSFHAAKAPPGTIATLRWSAFENGQPRASGRCLVAPGTSEDDCGFQLTISQDLDEGDVVRIVAEATDTALHPNLAQLPLDIRLHDKPSLSSISPSRGGTAGGTDILVFGSGFLAGSQALIDGEPLFPEGGIVVDENTISGHTPAHAAGTGLLTVRTPLGQVDATRPFTYLSPPLIAAIEPAAGPPAGGTAVSIMGANFSADTRIYFGPSLDDALPLAEQFVQNDSAIVGRAPAGRGPTTVWAFDDALGFTKLLGGFTWGTP
jgi:hypothetical protein